MTLRKLAGVARYALYDAGNSNFITLVVSLIFQLYLASLLPAGSKLVDLLWGLMIAAATVLSAVVGPKIGEIADRTGAKFRLLRWMSLLTIAGTALLPLLHGAHVALLVGVFVLTNTVYLLATVLYDSALADVTTTADAAGISSFAWGVGYAGGVIGLIWALHTHGPPVERFQTIFYIAAGLFLALGMPLMLTRDKPPARRAPVQVSFWAPIREFMRDRVRARMFLAYFLYSNGVSAVIYFTSLYATNTMHYDLDRLIWLFVIMNAVAAPAAILFGKLVKPLGHLRSLKVIVLGWVAAVIAVALSGERTFVLVACGAAALLGPVQALSRSLFRIIFPDDAMSSYFGVQAIASRGSSLVGPLLFGAITWITGSQRVGALSAAVLFGVGFLVLLLVPAKEVARLEQSAEAGGETAGLET